jgi:hypothetical protein
MSKEKNESLSKVAWGENGKRWKRTFSFSFLWPPSFGSTFTFLLLLLKRWIWIIRAFFFPGHNFQFNLENTCSHKLFEEEKEGE